MKWPKIMICLLTKNDARTLPKFLEEMTKLDYPKDKLRWVWIYGKSVDNTLDIILDFHKKNSYKYEIYEEPVFERKLNSPLYNARLCNEFKSLLRDEEYVLFADTDITKMPKNTIKELVKVNKDVVAPYVYIEGTNRFYDSVPGDTPIIVKEKDTGLIDILPIEDLKTKYEKYLVLEKTHEGTTKWTPILAVTYHPFKGKLKRLRTLETFIEISRNHSIYAREGKRLILKNAKHLKKGEKITRLLLRRAKGPKGKFFEGTEELAWLWGLFAAEGHASTYWHLSNYDREILTKVYSLVKKYYWPKPNLRGKYLESSSPKLARIFRERFYTSRGWKKVPKEILNAPPSIQRAFLEGFNVGDGTKRTASRMVLSSSSKPLLLGLIFLIRKLGFLYSISTRKDKANAITIIVHKTPKHKKDPLEILEIEDFYYEGELYDLTTESNRFCAGLGNILVHNTYVFRIRNWTFARIETESKIYDPWNPPFKNRKEAVELDSIGTFFLIKRKVFLEVNWDNPAPHLQFCNNCRKKGYKIWALPYLKIYHANVGEFEAPHFPVEYYVKKGVLPEEELAKVGYRKVGEGKWILNAKKLKRELE